MKIGDTLVGDRAPQVQGRPLTITCEVESKARDGVIVAHGGVAVGYALYLKGGHVVFAVHQGGQDIVRITSASAIGEKASVEARLAGDGTMGLMLDGASAATGKVIGLLNRQPAEAFCIGHDDARAVDGGYDGAKQFEGLIRNLKISTGTDR